ncbi:interactor of constitutive active ROPs protein [Rhynchospora pubera]|uniref:Interactor of constitutive active ROPs protein n=1 Tax=Rhynchospora pubera TaxID=906938 RepID=A0AAV8F6T9_9POAL|nr:interactor of constitutive active ROPs protein [Rhynchospora pubera]
MAQIGGRGEELVPGELMAVIPRDPHELLDLARRITSMAIESQVSQLEAEAVHLREKMSEKDRAISELKERLLELDQAFRDADGRLRSVLEENIKLSKERDSLAQTSKRLTHDVQKLEKFKRQLIQSLREDNPSFHKEAIDITTCDQFSPKVSLDGAIGKGTHDFSAMSSVPKFMSTSGLPRGSISAIGSPKLMPSSGVTSPTNKPQPELRVAMTPWHNPSSKRSSTVGSPTRARPISGRAHIDGKEFFRQARTRLSYEQFGAFLANIKELNGHKQSKEEALKKAQHIFGSENQDLYLSFYSLLNRNL